LPDQPIDFAAAKKRLEEAARVRCAHCGAWIPFQVSRCERCGVYFEGAAMQFTHPGERDDAANELLRRRRLALTLFVVAGAVGLGAALCMGQR
jgi:hypothetical protein